MGMLETMAGWGFPGAIREQAEMKFLEGQVKNLEAASKIHDLDYSIKKAEADRMNAERKFLKDALAMFTPQTTGEDPNTAGAVLPWKGAQSGPTAGLVNVPGAMPDMSDADVVDLMLKLKLMFPPATGDISANVGSLLTVKEKLGNLALAKRLFLPPEGTTDAAGSEPQFVPGPDLSPGPSLVSNPNFGKSPVNLRPGAGSSSLMADLIARAGQGDPEAIAQLGMAKTLGFDLGRLPELAKPQNTFKESVMEDGRTGLYKIDKTGKVSGDPILVTKNAEWVFSQPQETPQGRVVYEYRKDLGLQGSFNQGIVSIHQVAPTETTLQETTGGKGEKGLIRVPKFGKPGEVFPTAPPPQNIEGAPSPEAKKEVANYQTLIDTARSFTEQTRPDFLGTSGLAKDMRQKGTALGLTQSDPEYISWRTGYEGMKSTVRKELFGATLTSNEQKAFEKYFPSSMFNDLPGFQAQMGIIIKALELKRDNAIKGQIMSGTQLLQRAAREVPKAGQSPSPAKVAPAGEQYLKTATNPKTGEKIGLTKEGKWVKVK